MRQTTRRLINNNQISPAALRELARTARTLAAMTNDRSVKGKYLQEARAYEIAAERMSNAQKARP